MWTGRFLAIVIAGAAGRMAPFRRKGAPHGNHTRTTRHPVTAALPDADHAGRRVDGAGRRRQGRTKVKTTLTIRERVDIQTDNCEIAGGEISVSYAYEDDGSESATTSCSGGLLDGNVCINEATTMECYQVRRVVPTNPLDAISPMMPVNDMELAEPTPYHDAPTAGVGSAPAPVSDGGVVPGEGSRATVDAPLLVEPDGPPILPLD